MEVVDQGDSKTGYTRSGFFLRIYVSNRIRTLWSYGFFSNIIFFSNTRRLMSTCGLGLQPQSRTQMLTRFAHHIGLNSV